MFAYFTANIDFKTSAQLRSETVLTLSKHMALQVVETSDEFKQRENKGM